MSVTIEGVDESEGQSGTIVLQRNDDLYTGTLENDLDEDDEEEFKYKVIWDNERAPQETENPFGNDALGSINTEDSYFVKNSEGTVKLQVIWGYGNILHGDIYYQGEDTYFLQKQ